MNAQTQPKKGNRQQITLLMAGDNKLPRELLRIHLEESEEYRVVAEADSNSEAPRMAGETRPELIILSADDADETEKTCREIRATEDDARILVTDGKAAADRMIRMIAAGANGYFDKRNSLEELTRVIREVASGELRVPKAYAGHFAGALRARRNTAARPGLDALPEREREIVNLYLQGIHPAEIAARRDCKVTTIRNAIGSARKRLGLRRGENLIIWAEKKRLEEDATAVQ